MRICIPFYFQFCGSNCCFCWLWNLEFGIWIFDFGIGFGGLLFSWFYLFFLYISALRFFNTTLSLFEYSRPPPPSFRTPDIEGGEGGALFATVSRSRVGGVMGGYFL